MSKASNPLLLTERFHTALQLALQVHKDQIRKTSGAPYSSHLLSVCGLVLAQGGDEDEAIAALLHDSLEDHPLQCTPQLLQRDFGSRVLELVLECTDTDPSYQGGPKAPWLERKQTYLQRPKDKPLLSHRILLADKSDNLKSTIHAYRAMGDQVWSYFRATREQQLWYFQSFCKIMQDKGIESPLLVDYEEALKSFLFLIGDLNKAA